MGRQLIRRGHIDLPLPRSIGALRRDQNPFPREGIEASMRRARRMIHIDTGDLGRRACESRRLRTSN